jgi:hypothetical protein
MIAVHMRSIVLILLTIGICNNLKAQQDFKILESTSRKVVISYSPVYTDTSIKKIGSYEYRTVQMLSGIFLQYKNSGAPQIPSRSFQIGVPNIKGNRISIRSMTTKEIKGTLIPFPLLVKNPTNPEQLYVKNDIYNKTGTYPEQIVYESSSGSIRNLPVISVAVNAVRYNPQESKIILISNIEFEVVFSQGGTSSKAIADGFIDDIVVNSYSAQGFLAAKQLKTKTGSTNSVLASGKWVRFEAPVEGIYKITKDMFSSFGISTDVDVSTIKIYNNGGEVLPEQVETERPIDLVENAVYVSNTKDTILFYGRGVNFWNYETNSNDVKRCSSPYSNENYYWLTYGGAQGKRMQLKVSLSNDNPYIDTTTLAYTYIEEDKINIGKSGREFLGDAFTGNHNSRVYSQALEGLLSNHTIKYKYRFVNAAREAVSLTISENDNQLVNKYIAGYGSDAYSYGKADTGRFSYSGSISNNTSNLRFTFNTSSSLSTGYLDYYEIQYPRDLIAHSDFLTIFSPAVTNNIEYRLKGFSNNNIWGFDVGDYSNVKLISNPKRINAGEYHFQAAETGNAIVKYIACTPSQFRTPSNIKVIGNQDLHGNTTGAKLIIISPTEFIAQANRLKTQRETVSKIAISTQVVDINEIFNEFSCGNRDVSAIRDFIRYAYLNWTIAPEYVLLLGHGDYDYKDIEETNINFIIPYETEESLNEMSSYNTDDFFACIDGNDNFIDLAVGRIPAQSVAEAKISIDKIIVYENNSEHSLWRNTITLIADDSYTSAGPVDGVMHTGQSEDISTNYIPGSFNQNKIYLAAYPTEMTSYGRRKPKVNAAIIRAANEGTLVMNYIGHGSRDLWAHEQVFVKDISVPEFTNTNYFFLTAATCEFGCCDMTSGQSGAEMLLLKENSGAIGVFTATRPALSTQSSVLNNAFYTSMFFHSRDSLNLPIPIGKAYFLAKIDKAEINDQIYHLFCDPSLRLNIPQNSAQIDSINGIALTSDVQVKAMEKVSINGTIRLPGATTQYSGYTGEGILTIYDSNQKVPLTEFGDNYTITAEGGIIFKGQVSISNGKFAADFVIPKDISYENKNGKIVFYFYNNSEDGLAFSKKILVGGTDTTSVNDKSGPNISITFDNETSDGTFLIRPNSTLIVELDDETGLNTTGSGIGHRLQGILNQDESNILDFTTYFVGNKDAGGKSGLIKYQFSNLSEGDYRLDVKAWDVFNNASERAAYFKVVSGNALVIDNIYNYPNPFSDKTTFLFYHNYDGPVNVKIKIFTVAGRLIQQIEQNGVTARNVKINWDGRDKDNNTCANGVYLYKLLVSSTAGKTSKSYIGKISIIHR